MKYFQFCDTVILPDAGEPIDAHRNVLSASCPYFAAMFSGSYSKFMNEMFLLLFTLVAFARTLQRWRHKGD